MAGFERRMEMDAKYCLSGVALIVAIIDPLCVMEMDIVSDTAGHRLHPKLFPI